jgi:hypothetical protein
MFAYCYSLKTFVVSTPKNGPYDMFDDFCRYCCNLEKIVLPDGLRTLQSYYNFAYMYGSKVKRIVIPKSTTYVGLNSFNYSGGGFDEIDFSKHENIPTCQSPSSSSLSAFLQHNQNLKIIVPSSLYDSWIAKTGWKDVASLIYPAE